MSRSNLRQTFQAFFNPMSLGPFLVGSVCIALIGNAAFQLLVNLFGTTTGAAAKIALIALLVFIVAVIMFRSAVSRRLTVTLDPDPRKPRPRKGLILLVSSADVCRNAIQYHGDVLEKCWLICSVATLPTAKQIQQEYPQTCTPNPVVMNDVNDPKEFYFATQRIYARIPDGWKADDVIADYTGMTKHASVGMVLACLSEDRPLQYIKAAYDEQTKPQGPIEPIEITLSHRDIKSEVAENVDQP